MKVRTPFDTGEDDASGAPLFNGEAGLSAYFYQYGVSPGIEVLDFTEFAKGGSTAGSGTATSSLTSTVTNYYSGSANGTAGYDIWIEFKGTSWTAQYQQLFINAADYLTKVVTADIGGGGTYQGKVIDDLYISAELKNIDGVGGILGQAGPQALWTSNSLTAAGMIQLDVADFANYFNMGLADDIVTHETMHVLGLGSLWGYGKHKVLVSNFEYKGSAGVNAYKATVDPNAKFIPVEDEGGAGTKGSHWDEGKLKNELMTGYINNDGITSNTTDNYLSKFSVMALSDLGYVVAYGDYPYDGIFIA
jgi:Leishmanolysin